MRKLRWTLFVILTARFLTRCEVHFSDLDRLRAEVAQCKVRCSDEMQQFAALEAKEAELKSLVDMATWTATFKASYIPALSEYLPNIDFPSVAKGTTDADGKFSIGPVSTDCVLYAFASREVSGTKLEFCWLVKPDPLQRTILLTNHNTVDSVAPENFAAQSRRATQPPK